MSTLGKLLRKRLDRLESSGIATLPIPTALSAFQEVWVRGDCASQMFDEDELERFIEIFERAGVGESEWAAMPEKDRVWVEAVVSRWYARWQSQVDPADVARKRADSIRRIVAWERRPR